MFEQIIEMFRNLTPILWVSQITGIIGFIIILISYQFDKKKYILISTLGLVFLLAEQVIALLIANSISLFINIWRNILMFYFLEKKNKELPNYMILILLGLNWTTTLIYIHSIHAALEIFNYLPIIATTIQTIGQNSKNYYVVKLTILIGEACYIAYFALAGLPFSMFRELVLTGSAIISLVVLFIKDLKNKKVGVLNEKG